MALWREALLAQAVLAGCRGYQRHPQLVRFRLHPEPMPAIAAYLAGVEAEGRQRGYRFDPSRIRTGPTALLIPVTASQLAFERDHLLTKLGRRDPARYQTLRDTVDCDPHPLFVTVPGEVEAWERGTATRGNPKEAG